jgi:hypothetical protein
VDESKPTRGPAAMGPPQLNDGGPSFVQNDPRQDDVGSARGTGPAYLIPRAPEKNHANDQGTIGHGIGYA